MVDPATVFYLGLIMTCKLVKGYRHLETTSVLNEGAVRFESEED